MSKRSGGRGGEAPETGRSGGTNENKPKMNGVGVIFVLQLFVFSQLRSP